MGSSAHVTNIESLKDLRPAFIRFGENAQVAIRSTESEASKVLGVLQREKMPHWKRQIRIRSEQVVRANTKLIQQTTGDNPRPSVDARKALEHAKRQVREAEEKYERTRYWIRMLEKETVRYRASTQPMASLARISLTSAIARLDSLANALESYTSLATPSETKPNIKPTENQAEPESDPEETP